MVRMSTCAWLSAILLVLVSSPTQANAVIDHEVHQEDGVQIDWHATDNNQRGYVRVDDSGWVGAGTHDGAANGVGFHAGSESLVGYGLGAWWCDAGVKASEPDLIYARGTQCWGYECLDEGGLFAIVAYASEHPEEYAAFVTTHGRPC